MVYVFMSQVVWGLAVCDKRPGAIFLTDSHVKNKWFKPACSALVIKSAKIERFQQLQLFPVLFDLTLSGAGNNSHCCL